MSNIAPFSHANARNIALIRRTVAADTTDDEFNVFINMCARLGLDPLRRQAYALVYSKDNAKRRKMSIIVGIDGFRAVAARTGCYRPDDDEPKYELDESQKGPANPLGLVKATVKIFQHSHGAWFPVSGTAYWSEFAPIKEEWVENDEGKRRPTGKKAPEGKWATMPRLMLAKCAEAQALRKAWPDDFSNVYAPEEMDQAQVELLPAEAAIQGEQAERLARIGGGKSILLDMLDGSPITPVEIGKFADRVMAFIEAHRDEPSQIGLFQTRNRHALREFWAMSPNDSLELKKQFESAAGVQSP